MDKGTREVDKAPRSSSQPGSSPVKAILVLGTPVTRDITGRMDLGIALLKSGRGEVIIALGTGQECRVMEEVASKNRLSPSRLILDENSRTTIDNAYFAKKICGQQNLNPSILITSQYQSSRAMMTFRRVFGSDSYIQLYASLSLTSTTRRLREILLRMSIPLLFLFRSGDDEALKRASDLARRLLGPRRAVIHYGTDRT